MSTRKISFISRLAALLATLVLCAVLAVSASAQGRGNRDHSRGDRGGKQDVRANSSSHSRADRSSDKKERTESRPAPKVRQDRSNANRQRTETNGSGNNSYRPRPDTSRSESNSYSPRSDANGTRTEGYRPRVDNTRPKENNYKPRGSNYTSRGTSFTPRDNSHRASVDPYRSREDYHPSDTPAVHSKPAPAKRPDYHPAGSRVYTSNHTRVAANYHPRDYVPPTHRGGYYYYSARPKYKPCHYGFWVFGSYDRQFSRRSLYFYIGYFPYVQVSRVYVEPYVSVSYYSGSLLDDDYYLARHRTTELDETLSDIRTAWLDGRADLISDHVDLGRKIAVLLDGRYDYSIDSEDYVQMTADAIDQTRTLGFTWESVRERTNGDFTAFGKHTYRDPSGDTKSIYVSYTLRRIGGDYFITEVGSSNSRWF